MKISWEITYGEWHHKVEGLIIIKQSSIKAAIDEFWEKQPSKIIIQIKLLVNFNYEN